VDREGISPSEEVGDDVARLIALTERQHELWGLLRDAQDESLRNELFDELSANREQLAQLKDSVSARVDPPAASATPAVAPRAEAPPPRSVGEDLRSRLLTPTENVAPSSPPPPPPPTSPPPRVEPPMEMQPAWPPPEQQSQPEAESEAEPEPPADSAMPAGPEPPRTEPVAPTKSAEAGQELAPETAPFTSREADLAATRARRETARVRPEIEEPSSPQPQPQPQLSRPAPAPQPEPPAAHSEPSRSSADERLEAAHARYRDLQRVRPQHERSFSLLAIVVAVAAVAAVAWFVFFRSGGNSTEATSPATTATVAGAVVAPDPTVQQIRAVLDGLGMSSIAVEGRGGTIFLSGVVDSEADKTAAIGASQARRRNDH
jgi:hypothetical protein